MVNTIKLGPDVMAARIVQNELRKIISDREFETLKRMYKLRKIFKKRARNYFSNIVNRVLVDLLEIITSMSFYEAVYISYALADLLFIYRFFNIDTVNNIRKILPEVKLTGWNNAKKDYFDETFETQVKFILTRR